MSLVLCADFGSTFTKLVLVDVDAGSVVAGAEHPTTLATDVLDGFDTARARLAEHHPGMLTAPVLACSSAGGGLRIAVLGNEELVTAEAGRRVALSSGGKVVHVASGRLDANGLQQLADAEPDVLLLTGGTDGGNAEVVEHNAAALVGADWRTPIVVAANADSRERLAAVLAEGPAPSVLVENVVPRIGVLTPDGARTAIREVFLEHVIGGKGLSRRPDFLTMVRGATPDVVLSGVEMLAHEAGDVVVVDVGGATTDVHSVIDVDPEQGDTTGGLGREVIAVTAVGRTVEGDLGMRWSAVSTVATAAAATATPTETPTDADPASVTDLRAAAERRQREIDLVPETDAELDDDEAIARLAVGEALRRHAGRSRVVFSPEGRVVERTGRDLREVDLLVASGGVLRHGRPGVLDRVLAGSVGEGVEGGWQLPRRPAVVVDADYVLAAIGLLAAEHRETARSLARGLLGASALPGGEAPHSG